MLCKARRLSSYYGVTVWARDLGNVGRWEKRASVHLSITKEPPSSESLLPHQSRVISRGIFMVKGLLLVKGRGSACLQRVDGFYGTEKGEGFSLLCAMALPLALIIVRRTGICTTFIRFLPNSWRKRMMSWCSDYLSDGCVYAQFKGNLTSLQIAMEVAVMREGTLLGFIWLTQDILGFETLLYFGIL